MNSLFRRKNSLFREKNSLFFRSQGIWVQAFDLSDRLDTKNAKAIMPNLTSEAESWNKIPRQPGAMVAKAGQPWWEKIFFGIQSREGVHEPCLTAIFFLFNSGWAPPQLLFWRLP